ncbi:hypothetical protein Csa_015600 [Cucumis sativus]|nr:hypothetical protein Csa_015600 [Cucumis sativus]
MIASSHAARLLTKTDFISIDCGGVVDSVDSESGFPYKSDQNLIDSGVIGQISSDIADNYRLQYRHLRSFPHGVKNCYTLRPDSGRNNNYLIRAIFVYGNYDGKNTTPVFSIYVGVNLWSTIIYDDTRTEAIVVPPTDYIDVCLVNIGNGVPYISTLELRPLDNSVYRTDPQQFLVLSTRRDVGGDYRLRYPQDVDDRIWVEYDDDFNLSWLKKIQTNGSITQNSNDPYKIPASMLKTAYGTLNSSVPFVYEWFPYDFSPTIYFCFHFAEIEKLSSGTVREMSIVLNDIYTIAPSVILQYLVPQTICTTSAGIPVNINEENYLRISAASGSKLPPIINGFELFYFANLSYSPTFSQDVNAVMDIKNTFKLLNSDWQGDPCLPEFSIWSGLNCSHGNPPRIISLNLSRSNLTGEIPFSILNLTQLETLDLSYNNLSGSLPEFLAQLPLLKILDLTGNNLGGSVPEALHVKSIDGVLDLRVGDNPELCLSPPCKKKKKKVPVLPIIIAVVGSVILIIALVVLLIYKRSKKNANTDVLSWNERLQIAVDAAHGLDYLHNGCKPTIIHRDLKPANILLDDMLQAKIADFGLSRTFQVENQPEMLTRLAGTPGYFDPESQTLGNLNKKSDVYSFGIILFELITGSTAITRSYNGNNIHLLDWVAPIMKKGKIEDVVDVRIKGEFNHNSARRMAEIGMSCTKPNGNQRPDISVVLEELKECLAVEMSTLSESCEFSSTILSEFNVGPNLR